MSGVRHDCDGEGRRLERCNKKKYYRAQFDIIGILTALYIVITYIQTQKYAHTDVNETVMFIHICMSTHTYTHRHMYKCTQQC